MVGMKFIICLDLVIYFCLNFLSESFVIKNSSSSDP